MIIALFLIASLAFVAPAAVADETPPDTTTPQIQVEVQQPSPFTADNEKLGYGLGYTVGKNLREFKDYISLDVFFQGLRDAMEGREGKMTEDQIREALMAGQAQMEAEYAKKNEAFLEENKTKEGVKTLPSGLQYKVIQEGEGTPPTKDDKVRVHYRGTFIDGTEFDSSYKRGKPAEFNVSQVIPGWTEALQLMKPGAKWQIFIPAALAYGPQGNQRIPGNSTLIFDVELLEVLQ